MTSVFTYLTAENAAVKYLQELGIKPSVAAIIARKVREITELNPDRCHIDFVDFAVDMFSACDGFNFHIIISPYHSFREYSELVIKFELRG